MKKAIILLAVVATGAFAAWKIADLARIENVTTSTPSWLEADSAAAIRSRLLYDFPWTLEQARPILRQRYPELTDAEIDSFVELKYIETLVINDTLRVHRKAPRNLALLNPEMSGETGRGDIASEQRISYVDSILAWSRGKNALGGAHKVTFRFSIDVPYCEAIAGDSLRVWLPLPLGADAVDYQDSVTIISTSQPDYITSAQLSGTIPVHNSVYMTAPAPTNPGDTAHFEYVGSYIAKGRYASRRSIADNLQPYDTTSTLYKEYTAFDGPHYVRLDSLAHAIVGDNTNPLECSEMVFDYPPLHIARAHSWNSRTMDKRLDASPRRSEFPRLGCRVLRRHRMGSRRCFIRTLCQRKRSRSTTLLQQRHRFIPHVHQHRSWRPVRSRKEIRPQ